MVDNRSAGFFGIGGSFNFKSGDISGTAAKSQDDRQSPGMEYFQQGGQFEDEMEFNNFEEFIGSMNCCIGVERDDKVMKKYEIPPAVLDRDGWI